MLPGPVGFREVACRFRVGRNSGTFLPAVCGTIKKRLSRGDSLSFSGGYGLDDTLLEHSLGNFHEAGDVRTLHVVDVAVGLLAVFNASLVDALHDGVEPFVHFLARPGEVHAVLRHFEARGSYATGVDSLARSEEDAGLLESVDSFRSTSHVGNLGAAPGAVLEQFGSVVAVELVLECAGESDVALHAPSLLAGG